MGPKNAEFIRLREEYNEATSLYNVAIEKGGEDSMRVARKGLYHMVDRLIRITNLLEGDIEFSNFVKLKQDLNENLERHHQLYLKLLQDHPRRDKEKEEKYRAKHGKSIAIVSENPEIQRWL